MDVMGDKLVAITLTLVVTSTSFGDGLSNGLVALTFCRAAHKSSSPTDVPDR